MILLRSLLSAHQVSGPERGTADSELQTCLTPRGSRGLGRCGQQQMVRSLVTVPREKCSQGPAQGHGCRQRQGQVLFSVGEKEEENHPTETLKGRGTASGEAKDTDAKGLGHSSVGEGEGKLAGWQRGQGSEPPGGQLLRGERWVWAGAWGLMHRRGAGVGS